MSKNLFGQNHFKVTINSKRFTNGPFELTVKQCQLPGLEMGTVEQATPIVTVPRPGDSLQHGELTLDFIVLEDMSNWIEIFDWIVDMKSNTKIDMSEVYSDISLVIMSNKFNPIITFDFTNGFPYSLSPVDLTLETSGEPVSASVSFKFTNMSYSTSV